MERYTIEKDIPVFYVQAESFPDGVMGAYDKLRSLLPSLEGRTQYGISYMGEDGKIIYRAAVNEAHEGEGEKYGCKTFLIRKGPYMAVDLKNWMQNIPVISEIFRKLLDTPELDPKGYCLEWYYNDTDVMCMVKINS